MPLMSDLALPAAGSKIIIFAPHNDDEVLAAGGLIAKAEKQNIQVTIVFATNGDGHTSSTIEQSKDIKPAAQDYIQSGYTRQSESKTALSILNVPSQNIIFLGYPDGGLNDLLNQNWSQAYTSPKTLTNTSPYTNSYRANVAYTGENLSQDINSIINSIQPVMVFAPSESDTNHDHAALGKFVSQSVAADRTSKPQLYYYLVHFNHFPYPKGLHTTNYLTPPIRLVQTNGAWEKLMLSDQEISQKEQAVYAYKSQLASTPLLKSAMLGMIKKNEIFQRGF